MLELLLAPENVAFSSALLLMLLIGVVQATGLVGDMDAADIDASDAGAADALLAWAGIGRVPLLMWLVIFVAVFGARGLGLQQLMSSLAVRPCSTRTIVPLHRAAALGPTR